MYIYIYLYLYISREDMTLMGICIHSCPSTNPEDRRHSVAAGATQERVDQAGVGVGFWVLGLGLWFRGSAA